MHIHRPKAVHSLADFFWEVGIIVLGVLIALAGEQLVENLHNRYIAAETRHAVKEELETSLANLELRQRAEPCIERRLAELRSVMGEWARTGTFRTPTWVAQTPTMEIRLTRFDSAVSAGRLALLPNEEQYQVGTVADQLRRFDQDVQKQEMGIWGRLRTLQAGPASLSEADRAMLRTALQDASTLNYRAKLRIDQLLPEALGYGFRPNYDRFQETTVRAWKGGRYAPSICTPIYTPTAEANRNQTVPLPE